MRKKDISTFPMNLQLFGHKDTGDNGGKGDDGENTNGADDNNDDGDDDGEEDDDGDDGDQNSNKSGEKTFTQAQVTAMMTKEKKEGRAAVLKALGFKSFAEAQKAVKAHNAFIKSQQDDEGDGNNNQDNGQSEAEKRAEQAEAKLACVMAGVNKDSVDDIMAIAVTRVTDEKDLSVVLEEMKKQTKYAGFFKSEEDGDGSTGTSGTGSEPGHSKGKKGNDKGMATRLAKASTGGSKKSSYFG